MVAINRPKPPVKLGDTVFWFCNWCHFDFRGELVDIRRLVRHPEVRQLVFTCPECRNVSVISFSQTDFLLVTAVLDGRSE